MHLLIKFTPWNQILSMILPAVKTVWPIDALLPPIQLLLSFSAQSALIKERPEDIQSFFTLFSKLAFFERVYLLQHLHKSPVVFGKEENL